MAKEDSTADYIRRVRQQLNGVSHGEGMRRLEVERQNVSDRFSARALDELIHDEKAKFRKRILTRLVGWAAVLGVIFFVLIYFGGSGGSSDSSSSSTPAAKPAKSAKLAKSAHTTSTVLTDNKKPKKKGKSATKTKQSSRSNGLSTSSSSSRAASSSSKKQAFSSSPVKATSSSKATVASSSRPAAQTSRPSVSAKPAVKAPVRRTQPQQPVRPSTYTVKEGDNLYRIGVNHGLTLKQIQALNGMGNSHTIQPGEVLRVR